MGKLPLAIISIIDEEVKGKYKFIQIFAENLAKANEYTGEAIKDLDGNIDNIKTLKRKTASTEKGNERIKSSKE
ncbi:MAG: hypothetical protein AB6733_17390 [Clostridiaceae bacterium]